ncbi:hypothetical protein J2790_002210 [Paenarthrobacter nicotinovorans]|uniref:hypothetical protein n=1 Tax=Micrococcaceae TaxID=1268 RepID=UPI0008775426|nr:MULTISPECIES: hypothetical protein [Micrococcaceae]MDR6437067.1 hypothetical protein [Paenarthrobacter nicotinovorans]SCZ54651.1 hypothetical protein SAMN02799638_01549 [Arthrobacter sp. UNCCL28]
MKRGFVGLSTPMGYEYRNPIREREGSLSDVPNPVLESVNGLLLSYDELWFPSIDFCPKDLHGLDYVRFIDDEPIAKDRALVAAEQAREMFLPDDIPVVDFDLTERRRQAVRDVLPDIALDNHGRGNDFGMGNSADGQLFAADLMMAASLDFEVDVIVNSALAGSLHSLHVGESVKQVDAGFIPRAIEEVACLHSPDFLTAQGAYHESIEDLRSHARLAEFREFLQQEAPSQKDYVGLVSEVNRQVDGYAAMAMDRYLKGRGMLFTAGTATMGALGNMVAPVVGTALSGVFSLAKYMEEGAGRKKVGWSMFVLDIRKNGGRPTHN